MVVYAHPKFLPQTDESSYNFVKSNILSSFNIHNVDENEVSAILLNLKIRTAK